MDDMVSLADDDPSDNSSGGSSSSPSSSSTDSSDDSFEEQMEQWEEEEERYQRMLADAANQLQEIASSIRPRRHRSKKKEPYLRRDDDGNIVTVEPRHSTWYWMYAAPVNVNTPKFKSQFRRRFRMPHSSFLDLVKMVKEDTNEDGILTFGRWQTTDAVGVPASPIELLILGSLRYLGRGLTFDDIQEYTCIHRETHRQFFEQFIKFGRNTLYPKFVVAPSTAEEAYDCMHELSTAGFHGCVGSMDATHVLHERICHAQRQSHSGFKMSGAARTYNITVNHQRKILSSTPGHPSRWNDKTIVKFDPFLQDIRYNDLLQDCTFQLLERRNDVVVSQTYQGVWIMVDNGYLDWALTIPPIKETTSRKEELFSQWLECLRKDVECTFGILKGRWRILKAGIRVHGIEKADNIWHTCCALHNWLLEIDGLSERWENDRELGGFDERDVRLMAAHNVAFASENFNPQLLDNTRLGQNGDGAVQIDGNPDPASVPNTRNNVRVVKNLPFHYFRKKLIEHFSILYERREVKWPSRLGTAQPSFP
jgi:DDE superfamily endonuclease